MTLSSNKARSMLYRQHHHHTVNVTSSELMLYADDSVIVSSGKGVQAINEFSKEMENVQKLFIKNKLSIIFYTFL